MDERPFVAVGCAVVTVSDKTTVAIERDMRMPFRVRLARARAAAWAVADGVAGVLDGHSADVTELVLFVDEEAVLAVSCQQNEEAIMANVLQVGLAGLLAPRSSRFRHSNAVLCNQLRINGRRILATGDPAGYVEPVAMPKVTTRDLLYKTFDRCGDSSILHEPPEKLLNGRARLQRR